MHLLVLDGSRVLHSLVKRLAPEGVAVETAANFDEARQRLIDHPPQAMIVNLTPAELPWRELQSLCQGHSPPIPVLYESCVHRGPDDAGLASLNHSGRFLEKPYTMDELRDELLRLMAAAESEVAEPGPQH